MKVTTFFPPVTNAPFKIVAIINITKGHFGKSSIF